MRPRLRSRDLRAETGTSVTETMLLTWLILVFTAAALQIFIMNESLFRSLTATHAEMMKSGFQHNHWKYDGDEWDPCQTTDDDYQHNYNTDLHAKVIWNFNDFPEIRVQVLGMFRWWGGSQTVDIQSNVRGLEPDKGCGLFPCKKIKMGAGTAGPVDEGGAFWSRPVYLPGHIRLYCRAGQQFFDSLSDLFDYLKNF